MWLQHVAAAAVAVGTTESAGPATFSCSAVWRQHCCLCYSRAHVAAVAAAWTC